MRKRELLDKILKELMEKHGWYCPEYQPPMKTSKGFEYPAYYGNIARKGKFTFVAITGDLIPDIYFEDFVPQGKTWAVLYNGKYIIDSGRNLRPTEKVVERVVKASNIPVEKLVAIILKNS
ncbi:MAG: hypothetical protein ACXQTS_06065 [Candidatus Methanospirareceae archaeon]